MVIFRDFPYNSILFNTLEEAFFWLSFVDCFCCLFGWQRLNSVWKYPSLYSGAKGPMGGGPHC